MDPTSILTAILSLLPEPYRTWLASAICIAAILSLIASAFSAAVKPPSATAAKWLQVAYKVMTWPALNLGWARNAVPTGAYPAVQVAMKDAALIAHALPAEQIIAGTSPTGAAVIAPKTLGDVVVEGTVPLPAKGVL